MTCNVSNLSYFVQYNMTPRWLIIVRRIWCIDVLICQTQDSMQCLDAMFTTYHILSRYNVLNLSYFVKCNMNARWLVIIRRVGHVDVLMCQTCWCVDVSNARSKQHLQFVIMTDDFIFCQTQHEGKMTYHHGVATIRRLLKIIHRYFKRAL